MKRFVRTVICGLVAGLAFLGGYIFYDIKFAKTDEPTSIVTKIEEVKSEKTESKEDKSKETESKEDKSEETESEKTESKEVKSEETEFTELEKSDLKALEDLSVEVESLTEDEQLRLLSLIEKQESGKVTEYERKIAKYVRKNIADEIDYSVKLALDDVIKEDLSEYDRFLLGYTGTFVYTNESKLKSKEIFSSVRKFKDNIKNEFPSENPLSKSWTYPDTIKFEKQKDDKYSFSLNVAFANNPKELEMIKRLEVTGIAVLNETILELQFQELNLRNLD